MACCAGPEALDPALRRPGRFDTEIEVGVPSEDEADMLDLSFNLTPTSRLGCQIRISEALSGLRVHIPSDF